jgi:hypothetical protein
MAEEESIYRTAAATAAAGGGVCKRDPHLVRYGYTQTREQRRRRRAPYDGLHDRHLLRCSEYEC